MKTRALSIPKPIEDVGMGYYYTNMDVHEVERTAQASGSDGEGGETVEIVEYEFDQVTTFGYPTYSIVVEALIRERYTSSDELAIQRQRDTKPEDFAEYNAFCESCKAKAKPVFFPSEEGGE